MDQTSVLIRPIITEKSMDEAGRGRFSFAVMKYATKPEIKKAVEEQFKVNAISVQTLIMKGKSRRAGKRRMKVHMSSYKKAIVKLAQGQRIDLFEVPEKETQKTALKDKA